jgi:CrcB protein
MALEVLRKTLWVGAGGFLGASARYWLGAWVQARWGTAFPWATLAINVSGSFLLGLVMAALLERPGAPRAPELRLLLAVGFLGAYTTFSTFSYETLALLAAARWARALANALGSLLAGLAAVWLGVFLGRWR